MELRCLTSLIVQDAEAVGAVGLLRYADNGAASAAPPSRVMNSRRFIRPNRIRYP